MKLFKIILLSTCVALASISFATAKQADPAKKNKSDAEIIAFVIALDTHEVKAADLALTKKLDDNVKSFAEKMKTDHSKNLDDINALSQSISIAPDKTKAVMAFEKQGEKGLTELAKLDDKKFPTAYMNAMVKGHTKGLAMFTVFVKKANNADLKKFLTETRSTVSEHLKYAEKVKSEMKK